MSDTFGGKNVSDIRRASGFTLVEMVIVIVVVAILLAVAFPYFHELIVSNNITATTNQLLGEINVAKSEALRRGTLVAAISNSGSNSWGSGWIVKSDDAHVGNGTFAAGNDTVLRTNAGITQNGYTITTKLTTTVCATATTPQSDGMIIFNSKGNQPCNVASFDINVCRPDSKPTRSKRITIATSGLVTTKTDTTGSPAPPC